MSCASIISFKTYITKSRLVWIIWSLLLPAVNKKTEKKKTEKKCSGSRHALKLIEDRYWYIMICDIFILATCFMRIFTDQKSMYDGINRNAKFNPNLTRVLSYSHMCRSDRLGAGVDEVWFQNLFWRIFQPKQKFNQYAIS